MSSISPKDLPKSAITNPIVLLQFLLGREPMEEIRRSGSAQVAVALVMHDLADNIADQQTRRQIQTIAAKAASETAQSLSKQYS
jgi:hypothetical protein